MLEHEDAVSKEWFGRVMGQCLLLCVSRMRGSGSAVSRLSWPLFVAVLLAAVF